MHGPILKRFQLEVVARKTEDMKKVVLSDYSSGKLLKVWMQLSSHGKLKGSRVVQRCNRYMALKHETMWTDRDDEEEEEEDKDKEEDKEDKEDEEKEVQDDDDKSTSTPTNCCNGSFWRGFTTKICQALARGLKKVA